MAPAEPILSALAHHGLLLQQDKVLPSVVGLLTNSALSGSWWSHPKAQEIFAVLSELADHPDVLFTKLVAGKVTLVHRSLWPALLAVAGSGEAWQRDGLSTAARSLLARLESEASVSASGPAVKQLEARLLAHTEQVHTDAGRHEVAVQPWSTWSKQSGVAPAKSLRDAKRKLERAAMALGAPISALPWS